MFGLVASLHGLTKRSNPGPIRSFAHYRGARQLGRSCCGRAPRMANVTGPLVEQRVVAFASAILAWGRPGSPPSWPDLMAAPMQGLTSQRSP
jgi:hypothetical protein